MTSQPAWRQTHSAEDFDTFRNYDALPNHPLAVFLLRPESPWSMFFADLGDPDWRAAEQAYRTGSVALMLKHLENMGKRKRIAYVKKPEAAEIPRKAL